MKYVKLLNLSIDILSICNKKALERVFQKCHPNIVIMEATNKHVPLMENNVIEAVENNVFGTLNTIELAEKYSVDWVTWFLQLRPLIPHRLWVQQNVSANDCASTLVY